MEENIQPTEMFLYWKKIRQNIPLTIPKEII